MNFLTGLGDLAGGVSQGISPYLQQYAQQQQSAPIGAALMQAAGYPAQQSQGLLGSLGSGIQNMFGGGQASPMPASQPMTAQPGGGIPGQQQAQQAQPQQPPQPPQQSPLQLAQQNAPQPNMQPNMPQPGGGATMGLRELAPYVQAAMRANPRLTPAQIGAAFGPLLKSQMMTPYQQMGMSLREQQLRDTEA